ncbi:MAG: hypothetical protein NTZ56_24150 [Acidobacteria bacterium]|nr:hypothetical protein [Acidobacteriota bacterium]
MALWLMIAAAEILHGVLRTIFLVPWVGLHRSNQLGVFTGSLIILLITRFTIRFLVGAETAVPPRRLFAVGGLWLVLMLAFEWSAGHYVFGRTWDELAQDYRLARGGLLPLGMLVLLFSPLIAARR